jgi:hypothetical protein
MLDGMQDMASRHWANLRESAEFPTGVKEVVILVANSWEGMPTSLSDLR